MHPRSATVKIDSSSSKYDILYRMALALVICLLAAGPLLAQRQVKVVPFPSVQNIKDGLRQHSLKEVLAGVSGLKEGKVGEIIRMFSGRDTAWVWTVREDYLPRHTNAETRMTTTGVVTTLNSATLTGASRLSVARTVVHEMIHAYLVLHFRYDTAAAGNYPRIEAAYRGVVPEPDQNEVHHREMAFSFVGDIAAALKEYGRSLGLRVDESVYTDLAWGGLDFQNNDGLAEENKERIRQRLQAEQLGAPVFPVFPAGPLMTD